MTHRARRIVGGMAVCLLAILTPAPASGTILGWEISSPIEATDFTPASLPPLAFAMNPGGLRGIGVMSRVGDAVYLPLKRGKNEVVFAVIECTGGWAFSARLDPR